MPSLTTVALFALATLLLTASPGPGVFYVLARTLSQGRTAGFASMFGIEFGEVLWLAASTTLLTILRFGGAAYLIYLGVQRWRHLESLATPRPAPIPRLFTQGLITQLLNPKVV